MNAKEQQEMARGAARSYLREQGIDPLAVEVKDALLALDDLLRLDSDTIAARWYDSASDNQIKLFGREWNAWRVEWCKLNRAAWRLKKGDDSLVLALVRERQEELADREN